MSKNAAARLRKKRQSARATSILDRSAALLGVRKWEDIPNAIRDLQTAAGAKPSVPLALPPP